MLMPLQVRTAGWRGLTVERDARTHLWCMASVSDLPSHGVTVWSRHSWMKAGKVWNTKNSLTSFRMRLSLTRESLWEGKNSESEQGRRQAASAESHLAVRVFDVVLVNVGVEHDLEGVIRAAAHVLGGLADDLARGRPI